jgi:isopentenyl phosphate kinase
MMPELVLLKLGGSVVTNKRGDAAIDHAAIRAIATMLGEAGFSGAIVHGAGSCGHPEAHRYGLALGADRSTRTGIPVTHEAVASLNRAVVATLRAAGLDAVGISPLAACTAEAGRIASFEEEPLRILLGLGAVPVLHGDVVMDRERGACIISGDQLVAYLAPRLGLRRVGLVTDVPGVLGPGGTVVPRISRAGVKGLMLGASATTDVTGGMEGKVAELLLLADEGISSHVFGRERLADFLREDGGRPADRLALSFRFPGGGINLGRLFVDHHSRFRQLAFWLGRSIFCHRLFSFSLF